MRLTPIGTITCPRDVPEKAHHAHRSLCAARGRVFVRDSRNLHAFDARTGHPLWRADAVYCDDPEPKNGRPMTLILEPDMWAQRESEVVAVLSMHGSGVRVDGFDVSQGTRLWQRTIRGPRKRSEVPTGLIVTDDGPPVVSATFADFGSDVVLRLADPMGDLDSTPGTSLVRIDASDGRVRWQQRYPDMAPALVSDRRAVYAGGKDVCEIDPASGASRVAWTEAGEVLAACRWRDRIVAISKAKAGRFDLVTASPDGSMSHRHQVAERGVRHASLHPFDNAIAVKFNEIRVHFRSREVAEWHALDDGAIVDVIEQCGTCPLFVLTRRHSGTLHGLDPETGETVSRVATALPGTYRPVRVPESPAVVCRSSRGPWFLDLESGDHHLYAPARHLTPLVATSGVVVLGGRPNTLQLVRIEG